MNRTSYKHSWIVVLTAAQLLTWSCAQKEITPITCTGTDCINPSPTSTGQTGDTPSDIWKGDGEGTGGGEIDLNDQDPTMYAQCITECKASCDATFSAGSERNECYDNCTLLPWDEGGCAPTIDKSPKGDPILIPYGSKEVKGSVKFCTHNREEYLIFQSGSFSFSSQKGLSKSDVEKEGAFGFLSSLLSSPSSFVESNMPFFATAGNQATLAGLAPGASGLEQKAKIKIPADGEEKEWPYPGALSYSVLKHLPDDRDTEKPVIFVMTKVEEDGDSVHRAMKSVDKQVHFNDYYGPNANVDIVKIKKINKLTFGGIVRIPTNCRFTISFSLWYLPKG